MEVKVDINLKEGVLDPEGKTIKNSLDLLGFEEVNEVRVGKEINIKMEVESKEKAKEKIREMCERLLANPVIHEYEIEILN
ncbi:phosphoribosylformylglycinamidine synthase [archaeon SCG-AAA382B04]|nr:phosphoribosylformylglycinamidine synthase [archaeon SCG-AAA382B04]